MLYGWSQTCDELLRSCIIENGQNFINTPYKSGTLDLNTNEQLTYFNDKFDCVTFVEYILALSQIQVSSKYTSHDFDAVLTQIRYKNGIINGYASRLHYFSAWILQNSKHGYLTDITRSFGGMAWKKRIHFISTNRKKYPKLKNQYDMQKLREDERFLSNTSHFYIPKEKIKAVISKIEDGDIIAFTTDIEGLDIVHVGIAVTQNGVVRLLHASSEEKKVIISREALDTYIKHNKNQTGIIVLRPQCF